MDATNEPKLSIIVPVCNVEKYLEECIKNLTNQTFFDIEIICINDGSIDRSLDILLDLKNEDQRIKIIDRENKGYGYTINEGIQLAKGEYIGIIESDDFAERNMYEKLYFAAKKYDADVVKSNFYFYYEGTGKKEMCEYLEAMPYDCLIEPNYKLLLLGPTIWAGIYRREFLIQNNIKLLETNGASYQDTSFAFKVMYAAKRITFIKDALLNYRSDNVTSSVNSNVKTFYILQEVKEEENYIKSRGGGIEDFQALSRVKLLRYRWNLERLKGQNKLKFLLFMYNDLREDDLKGYIVKSDLWIREAWDYVHKLLYDFDDFAKEILTDSEITPTYDKECEKTKFDIMRLQDGVSVYGAGIRGMKVARKLAEENICVKRFIVTKLGENGAKVIEGIPVQSIDNAIGINEDIIVLGVSDQYRDEVIMELKKRYLCNYVEIRL